MLSKVYLKGYTPVSTYIFVCLGIIYYLRINADMDLKIWHITENPSLFGIKFMENESFNNPSQTGGHIQEGVQPTLNSGSNKEGKEKFDWVAKAIEYEATPKSLREPKEKGKFIESLGVPSSTYYDKISETETQRIIIDICFKQAKKRTPEILEKLGEKAEKGDNVSIGQFMDYVLEKAKKSELTGKDGKDLIPDTASKEKIKSIIGEYLNEKNRGNN